MSSLSEGIVSVSDKAVESTAIVKVVRSPAVVGVVVEEELPPPVGVVVVVEPFT